MPTLYRKKAMAIYPDLGVLSPSSNQRLFECIENKFTSLCWFLLPRIISPTKPCELHFEISPLFVLSVSIHPEPDTNMEIAKLQAAINEVLIMALREVSEYLYSLDSEYLAEVAEHLHVCLYDYCNQPTDSE